jgi:hypothetical protein
MSLHEWYIFPTQPHLPAPDWPALSQRLIEVGLLCPSDGQHVAPEDLLEVSRELTFAGHGPWIDVDPAWRRTSQVVDAYRTTRASASGLSLPDGLSMIDTVARLRMQGLAFALWPDPGTWTWGGARHRLAPGAAPLFDSPEEWETDAAALSISLLACEGTPTVTAGENLCAPTRPGEHNPLESLAPYGDAMAFIGAAFDDPSATWTDPVSGKAFHLLDLDWQHSLGFGFRFVKIEGGGSEAFVERLTDRLTSLVGQPMTYAHLHL